MYRPHLVRGEFGKRPDFFRILICAPFPKLCNHYHDQNQNQKIQIPTGSLSGKLWVKLFLPHRFGLIRHSVRWTPLEIMAFSRCHSITFTFSKSKMVSAVFSYPPTLFPDWLKTTHSEQRTYHGNADWKQILLMCSVQSLLQHEQRPKSAHASAWWKEDPQLQPVRLLNHRSC